MLDKGLTEDGAAQALGWPKARVTARVKLLELPEKARELVGTGVIPLSAVDQLRAIGTVSPQLLEVLVDYLDGDPDGHTWAASQLLSDPGYVLDDALRESDSKAFAAYLHQLPSGAIDELRLGKKATEQSPRRRSSNARSTSTPTAGRRSASPSRTSTERAPPAS